MIPTDMNDTTPTTTTSATTTTPDTSTSTPTPTPADSTNATPTTTDSTPANNNNNISNSSAFGGMSITQLLNLIALAFNENIKTTITPMRRAMPHMTNFNVHGYPGNPIEICSFLIAL